MKQMKKNSGCYAFLIILWAILFMTPGLTPGIQICWAGATVRLDIENSDLNAPKSDYFISATMAAEIADTHAKKVWDVGVARGKPFLLHNAKGNPFAYVFPYALNATEFPSYDTIFKAVRAAGDTEVTSDDLFSTRLENMIGSFGCIEVAISRSDFPILVMRQSLHPYFLYSEKAAEVAKRRLNSPSVDLENIEFNGPHELYFNFSSPKGNLKLHAYLLKTKEELVPACTEDDFQSENAVADDEEITLRKKAAWEEMDNHAIENVIQTVKWIPHYSLIPVVDWTHWCVPTAATMAAGYWDNYDRQGTWTGYGRLIDYWSEHGPICQNNNVTNVPNLIDEFISHSGNCSWLPGGFAGALNSKNGYNFSWTDTKGTPQNDWNWPLIMSEVNNDRPSVWGVGPASGHAMTAWGYRIVGSQKFVRVYNTWGATARQQTAEYNYDQWSGAPNTKTGIGRLIPGGGTGGNHAVLTYPRGGETVTGSTNIRWFVWGSDIKWANILFSSNGGKTWKAVHTSWFLSSKPGWNSYTAALDKSTSKGRVRIRWFSSNFTHIAGDGSIRNFFVQGKPDLVPVPTCKRDIEGRLVITVKNQGTVQAAASTTRVGFFPGGAFNVNFPAIPSGSTAKVPLQMPAPCWNPDCDYQITVDINNQVNESNEANNSGSGSCFS